MIKELKNQKGKYHLFIEGVIAGRNIREKQQINCINQMVNPYKEFDNYLKLAENENLNFVFSNTTEAGIALEPSDIFEARPPKSFPGKLTRLLYHRFQKFDGDPLKVLHIIPCELIDKNGNKLKEIILELCDIWELEEDFKSWIQKNYFYNTIVDRIVPGFPKKDLEFYKKDLPFNDKLIVTCEPFFFWVIEGSKDLLRIFPVDQLENISVKVLPDIGIYRTRKVRILNGSHTTIVPIGLLHGTLTVSETLKDDFIKNFLSNTIFEEIIPSIAFDKEELEEYARSVLERFSNPFIIHRMESISLNSISKFKVRVLPSLLSYYNKLGKIPKNLTFAFASLIYFYGKEVSKHPYPIKDDPQKISLFREIWKENKIEKVVEKTLTNSVLWDQNLAEIDPLKDVLNQALNAIASNNKISEAYSVYQRLLS
tara:strand:- start:525 stop:1802 length:1278 start_codon:yes stop_codon:yes gene_type:complete